MLHRYKYASYWQWSCKLTLLEAKDASNWCHSLRWCFHIFTHSSLFGQRIPEARLSREILNEIEDFIVPMLEARGGKVFFWRTKIQEDWGSWRNPSVCVQLYSLICNDSYCSICLRSYIGYDITNLVWSSMVVCVCIRHFNVHRIYCDCVSSLDI